MIFGGAGLLVLYVRHARREPDAILDIGLLKIPTFFAGVVGGFLFRIGIGAIPFLLPLLLQIGFGLSAVRIGLAHLRRGGGRDADEIQRRRQS